MLFRSVLAACAAPRAGAPGTWITEEMTAVYGELHALGHAHSIETWRRGELVGGLYGLCLGRVFFGESMFSRATDASKVALARLVEECLAHGIALIDCQVDSAHVASLGSRNLPRRRFLELLSQHVDVASVWPHK